jgi:LPS-assembly lipoprotein
MTTRTALSLVLLVIGIALSGCGFTPVYGTHANAGKNASVASAMDNTYIDSIPDRTGQKLRNFLMDRMYSSGRTPLADASYRLSVSPVTEYIYGLGIAKDATATRSQIKLMTDFVLSGRDGSELMRRSLVAVSSFNTLASQYTTLVTEEDARDQAIHDLAEQILTMTELYFTSPDKFVAPKPLDVVPEDDRMKIKEDRPYETDFSRD